MTSNDNITKKCPKCLINKEITAFGIARNRYSGRNCYCRPCSLEVSSVYRKTKKGVISTIYGHQKGHSKSRGHEPPDYTLNELREWALSKKVFHKLFDIWTWSGYKKDLIPSFDRTDDSQGYSLNRLQIITWAENRKKSVSDMRSGLLDKKHRPVVQLTIDNEFIAEHHSLHHAGRVTNATYQNIYRCCTNSIKTAGGFKWRYG